MSRWIKLGFAFLVLRAAPVLSCPVCFQAKEDTRIAFYVTTALLSFLPLIMIGGIIWWIVRQTKASENLPSVGSGTV